MRWKAQYNEVRKKRESGYGSRLRDKLARLGDPREMMSTAGCLIISGDARAISPMYPALLRGAEVASYKKRGAPARKGRFGMGRCGGILAIEEIEEEMCYLQGASGNMIFQRVCEDALVRRTGCSLHWVCIRTYSSLRGAIWP